MWGYGGVRKRRFAGRRYGYGSGRFKRRRTIGGTQVWQSGSDYRDRFVPARYAFKGLRRQFGTVRIPPSIGPFPRSVSVCFRYADQVSITTTAGVGFQYVFRGNSLFDPDVTSSGHQPYGFDQWSAVFQRYCVFASWIRVSVSLDIPLPCKFLLLPTQLNTGLITSDTFESLIEQPYCKWRVGQSSGGQDDNSLTNYMSTAKIMGQSPGLIENDDNLYALTNANPTNPWYWLLGVNSPQGDSSQTVKLVIEMRFWAKMFDGQPLNAS